jgi:hypothetical protein
LRGDVEAERLHARELVLPRDEAVLDGEAPFLDAAVLIGFLVRVEHEIDGGVSYGVGRHPKSPPIQLPNELDISLRGHGLETVELAFLSPGLFIGLPHEPALETSVDAG